MNRWSGTLCLALGLSMVPAAGHAQLARSSFVSSSEGWLSVTMPYPSAVPPTELASYTPDWISSLGGYIRIADPDGSGPTGNVQYWSAPASFLGYKAAAYGGALDFDLANEGSGSGSFAQEDILLVGGGVTLVHDLGGVPIGSFTHYSIPMSEAGWKSGGLAGPAATVAEFKEVLFSLTHLYIRAEYQLGPDTEYLDNVTLSAGTVAAPGVIPPTSFALSAPAPNPTPAGARLDFSLPSAGQADVAVFDASGRRVATLADGRWPAGVHPVFWNGRDASGHDAAPGLYWARATFGSLRAVRTLVRLR